MSPEKLKITFPKPLSLDEMLESVFWDGNPMYKSVHG
jgi:hypothetical protein